MPAKGPGYLDALAKRPSQPKSRTARRRLAAATPKHARRACAYGRLSLLTDESTSPERQREGTERYIKAMDFAYDPKVDFYGDFDSISGSKENVFRPAFNDMMSKLDQYDVIVVWKLDRFTRRLAELVVVLDVLKEKGVALIALEDGIDTSKGAHAQLLASIIGAVAQMEAENTGERVASAQEYMTKNGRYRGGQRPWGFRDAATAVPGGYIFAQEPNEVVWIGKAIKAILDGQSFRSVVLMLDREGVEPPRARSMREGWEKRKLQAERDGKTFVEPAPDTSKFTWNVPAVRYILRNPILVGHGRFGEDLIRDDDGEPIEIAPPIIDLAKFNKLQSKIEDRGKGGPGINRGQYQSLLSGIASCGYCGAKLMRNGRSYTCRAGRAPVGERTCKGVAISQDALNTYVLRWLANELSDDQINVAAEAFVDEPVVDIHEVERTDVNRRIARLREDREMGLYDSEEQKAAYKRKMAEHLKRLEELRPALAIHDELAEILGGRVTLEGLLEGSVADVRAFLRAALRELKVLKATSQRQPIEERVEVALVAALEGPGRAA